MANEKPWDTVEVLVDVLHFDRQRGQVLVRTLEGGYRTVYLPCAYLIFYEDDRSMQMPRWLSDKNGFTQHEFDYTPEWKKRQKREMSEVRSGGGSALSGGEAARHGGESAGPTSEDKAVGILSDGELPREPD